MPTIERDGAQIWYADMGQGPPVLLVHGGLFDLAASDFFWVESGVAAGVVAAGYRIVMPDRRFSGGRTTAPFAVHTWDVEAADLAAVVRRSHAAPAHVVAGSNGCSAVIRLALTEPALVRSLILCWPVAPDLSGRGLWQDFRVSAHFIEHHGASAYLARLRTDGLPRHGDNVRQPGFPWGVALLRDVAMADAFAALPAEHAAAIMRDSAAALLSGDLLRGVNAVDATRLARLGPRITVVPPDPDAGSHTRAIAERLAAAIPGADLIRGIPVGPSPEWPIMLRQALVTAG